jgi:hypothetical protein
MAGFSFLANMLPTALTVANTLNKNRQQQKQSDAALYNQQQQIAVQAEADATARRQSLQRAMARQRAQFGAQGVSGSDGSASAILLGLRDQAEAEQDQADKLSGLRNSALQASAKTKQRKNLLSLNETYDAMRLSSLFNE